MRPVLKPALRRLWRDPATLQLGITRSHAVVLAGLSPTDRSVLDLLDGSRDVDTLLDAATEVGVERETAARLLTALQHADALDDATAIPAPSLGEDERQRLEPDMLSLSLRHRGPGAVARVHERRRHAGVAVHGTGPVGAEAAMLLAAAGVGTLACLDDAPLRRADVTPGGLPRVLTDTRGNVTALRAGRFTTMTRATNQRPEQVTLALVTPASSEALPEIATGVRGEPHLLACVRETTGVVGPLVVPGVTSCLRCLALTRSERDPHWPLLSAQLVGSAVTEPCEVALAGLVASLAAMQALAYIDGDESPPVAGALLEYDALGATLRRRTVGVHPACGCGASHAEDVMPALVATEGNDTNGVASSNL
jgi:bacteriocin biosynthesis cyclodehydratase domain-containing protein